MTSSGKTINAESIWGGYYIPDNLPIRAKKGLRVVVFGSAIGGQMVLESLIRFEHKYPDLVNIVGLATDDPVDPKARISLKKRIWSNSGTGSLPDRFKQVFHVIQAKLRLITSDKYIFHGTLTFLS
jgi:hypothetical protein